MKKILILTLLLAGCSSLSHYEKAELSKLSHQNIRPDNPDLKWVPPASPGLAATLNILPGVGNFYLAAGNAGDSDHYTYGVLNLLTWPISIIWAVPSGAIAANNINQRDFVYYSNYGLE